MGLEVCAESPMHREVGAKNIGPRIETHRRCVGDAARSSDPIYSDPIWEAQITHRLPHYAGVRDVRGRQ
eukprot:2854622-Pyramimonas_sp.AAC.1